MAIISERSDSKERRRQGMQSYNGEGVFIINARPKPGDDPGRKLRVAGYARVSTDDEEQVTSIELQKNEIPQKIKENPNWVYVGQYVDEGASGTNTEKRLAFNMMIEDCLAGKIDMIYTKSVSRFARNLGDCIEYVKKLKAHDPPIGIYFEAEHFGTLDPTSAMLIVVLGMVAEEESHMKSEAMLVSLEARFKVGRFLLPKLLGYDSVKDENGRRMLVVNPEEAKTIRLMYYMILNGESLVEIAQTLTDLERPSGSGRRVWSDRMVVGYLRNERYCGDVLARKTWTPDFHDHLAKKNNGSRNRHFKPGHHEAIVTREQWNAAQRILNSIQYGHTGAYLPMSVVDSGDLAGYVLVDVHWAGYEAEDFFQASARIEADLGNQYLPDEGHPLNMVVKENGIYKNARNLTKEEKEFQSKQNAGQENEKKKTGFQVVSSEMFSMAKEPVARFTPRGIYFSKQCIRLLDAGDAGDAGKAELLIHPVDRILVIRPCTQSKSVFPWGKDYICARPFCKSVYAIMNWEDWITYTVFPFVKEGVLFIDLTNWVGRPMDVKNNPS
ncbi:MAG: recombinase family protein, partial [Blautia sp.]|nr:recombinase family protein [Blautia sp.]